MTEKSSLTQEQRDLVEKNLDLAHFLAAAAYRRLPSHLDADEVIAVAYEGLVQAALRFDPSRANVVDGVADIRGAFSGYARRRINGAILDWQNRNDHVPRRQRTTFRELQALGYGQGRSVEDLADLTGLAPEKIRAIAAAVEHQPLSLDWEPPSLRGSKNDETNSSAFNSLRFEPQARPLESTALVTRIQDTVVSVFDGLTDLQRIVIALRYYEGKDLSTISAVLGVRLTLVKVAHSEGLTLLHAAMLSEAS